MACARPPLSLSKKTPGWEGFVKYVLIAELLKRFDPTEASLRLLTPAIKSSTGFAARPGTEVLPI
jgi:hypothetical protein